jgi:large subunit ribosomal protein L4
VSVDLTLYKTGKKKSEKVTVSDHVFAAEYNEPLIHQVVTAYLAGSRAGTKAQKNRSDVRGGGRKPWRQKGLGRARAGTIRSPLWRGGGITFAARPRSFAKKVNRKMYRGAMRSILSELARQNRLQCIDEFKPVTARTKAAKEILNGLGLTDVLIITDEVSKDLYLSTRNLPKVEVIDTKEVNPYALIGFDQVLVTRAAIPRLEAWLA